MKYSTIQSGRKLYQITKEIARRKAKRALLKKLDEIEARKKKASAKQYYEWRREREDYLKNPSYYHPKTGQPLKEPYKPSKRRGVTIDGIPARQYQPKLYKL